MTSKDLESIKTRLGKATAGEWLISQTKSFNKKFVIVSADSYSEPIASVERPTIEQIKADANFIAHSKQDIESLLGEVQRLKEDSEKPNWTDPELKELVEKLQQENSRLKEFRCQHHASDSATTTCCNDKSCFICYSEYKRGFDEGYKNGELDAKEESQRYRTALEKMEREIEQFRSWCLATFGTTHPEMQHDPMPTYTELKEALEEISEFETDGQTGPIRPSDEAMIAKEALLPREGSGK